MQSHELLREVIQKSGAKQVSADLNLSADRTMSRFHCEIVVEEGRALIRDLGSTNGTRVNERRVSRHGLQDGDVIRVGDTSLRFKLTQGR